MSIRSARAGALWLHRYSGLAMAAFLTIAGLTGTIIAFGDELDAWLNRDLFQAPSTGTTRAPVALAAQVEAADPRLRVQALPLTVHPGEAMVLGVAPRTDPATNRPYALGFNQLFVDPESGAVIGRRDVSARGLDRRHFVMTMRALHASLLAGPSGRGFLGAVAIAWTINCFLGFWLALPRGEPFLTGWLASWRIRRRASATRVLLDLHRAGALWTWAVLLVLAISSVHLGLYQPVFRPLVGLFSPLTPSLAEQGRERFRATPGEPRLGLGEAVASAERESAGRGWHLIPARLRRLPTYGVYSVTLTRSGDEEESGLGATRLFIDDTDGHVVTSQVAGEGTAGDVFLQLQFPLHSGEIAGLAGRAGVACAGLVVAMLSVTGVLLWWRRRRAMAAR